MFCLFFRVINRRFCPMIQFILFDTFSFRFFTIICKRIKVQTSLELLSVAILMISLDSLKSFTPRRSSESFSETFILIWYSHSDIIHSSIFQSLIILTRNYYDRTKFSRDYDIYSEKGFKNYSFDIITKSLVEIGNTTYKIEPMVGLSVVRSRVYDCKNSK